MNRNYTKRTGNNITCIGYTVSKLWTFRAFLLLTAAPCNNAECNIRSIDTSKSWIASPNTSAWKSGTTWVRHWNGYLSKRQEQAWSIMKHNQSVKYLLTLWNSLIALALAQRTSSNPKTHLPCSMGLISKGEINWHQPFTSEIFASPGVRATRVEDTISVPNRRGLDVKRDYVHTGARWALLGC